MTPQQIDDVQRSWRQVFALRETAAPMFYERLFEQAPALRPLFAADMTRQAGKLFDTLEAIVASLADPAAIARMAEPLARSHAGHGATPADYDAVCEALLWTFQGCLGSGFTPALRSAWEQAYRQLAGAMQRG